MDKFKSAVKLLPPCGYFISFPAMSEWHRKNGFQIGDFDYDVVKISNLVSHYYIKEWATPFK